MLKKVAILANGGDVAGFNAVIRGIVKTAENSGVECYGFIDGYNGLLKNEYVLLSTAENGNAEGELYMDDGCTYNYNAGSFMSRKIVYSNNNLKFVYNEDGETEIPKESQEMFINKITFYGIKGIPNIIDDSDIYCANGTCIMANIKLYPYLVQNDQKKDSKIMYIAIGCVTGAVIIIAIMIVILKKMKHKKDELNSKPLLTNE